MNILLIYLSFKLDKYKVEKYKRCIVLLKTVINPRKMTSLFADVSQIVSCGEDKFLRILDLDSGTEIFVRHLQQTVM